MPRMNWAVSSLSGTPLSQLPASVKIPPPLSIQLVVTACVGEQAMTKRRSTAATAARMANHTTLRLADRRGIEVLSAVESRDPRPGGGQIRPNDLPPRGAPAA